MDAAKGREPVAPVAAECSYRPLSVSMPQNWPTHSMVRTSLSARVGWGRTGAVGGRPASHRSGSTR
jgi:hypothetical protein